MAGTRVLGTAVTGKLLSVALLASSLAGCEQLDTHQELDMSALGEDPGYAVLGAELLETDEQGLPRYRLAAQRIVQQPESLWIKIEQPRLAVHEGGVPVWQVSADRGELPGDADSIRLDGNVRVVSTAGRNDPAGQGPALTFNASSLEYDFRSGIARTHDAVTLAVAGHRLQGVGLEADLRTRRARLMGAVQGRFEP